MTQVTSVGVGYLQGNKLSFKRKALAGYWEDLKASCASAGRMDIYKRLAAHRGRGVGRHALISLSAQMRAGKVDSAEAYLAKVEEGSPLPPQDILRTQRHKQVACRSFGARPKMNRDLDPPPVFADEKL